MTPLKAVPIDISAVSGLPKFEVVVQIVIGKDGRVVEAKALSGPKAAYKAAESAARKWTYLPYLVAGQPAEQILIRSIAARLKRMPWLVNRLLVNDSF
jgi:hypothetical protein